MKEPKTTLTREQRAAYLAEKKRFDAVAKRAYCMRCQVSGRRAEIRTRIRIRTSTSIAVLPLSRWLCKECHAGLSEYLNEVRDKQREEDRPRREAEQAARKQALDASLAQKRAELNSRRAAEGLPPIVTKKSPSPKKPGRKPPTP